METVPNPRGPHAPPDDAQVPDGDVREPPLPGEQRTERFPGKDRGEGGIKKLT
jgi:hypothetical protein